MRNVEVSGQRTFIIVESPFGPLALDHETLAAAIAAATRLAPLTAVRPKETSDKRDSRSTLLDADVAAEQLGLTPSWLLQRAREGRLPHHRIGKYVRFDIDEIRAFSRQFPDRHANTEETHPQQHPDSKR